MTETEEETAFSIGSEMVEMAKNKGCDIVLFGEMGVGNSTAASAVIARLCSSGVEEVTTSASGLSADELSHKREVVKAGLALHPEKKGKEVIRAFGGFETAAIAGAMVTASRLSIPILLDGMITNAAALAAVDMRKEILERMSESNSEFKDIASTMSIKDSIDSAADDIAIKKLEVINKHEDQTGFLGLHLWKSRL